jgi:hypothetical protein
MKIIQSTLSLAVLSQKGSKILFRKDRPSYGTTCIPTLNQLGFLPKNQPDFHWKYGLEKIVKAIFKENVPDC